MRIAISRFCWLALGFFLACSACAEEEDSKPAGPAETAPRPRELTREEARVLLSRRMAKPTVETLKENLEAEKENEFLRRNQQRLQEIDQRDLPESLRKGLKYGYLIQDRAWKERIMRAEMSLLYGLLLEFAEKHNGQLPGSLDELGEVPDLDVGTYHYYPVAATEELHRDTVLVFSREPLVFLDGDTFFLMGGNETASVDAQTYKTMVQRGEIYTPPLDLPTPGEEKNRPELRLERSMWHMEPQLPVLMGDGRVGEIYKSTIDEILGQNNEIRATMGEPPIPVGPVRMLFAPYDDSIYDPYRWLGSSTRDRHGRRRGSEMARKPEVTDATNAGGTERAEELRNRWFDVPLSTSQDRHFR